jgi:hypothetical protein
MPLVALATPKAELSVPPAVKVSVGKSSDFMYFDIGDDTDLGSFGGEDHWFVPNDPDFLKMMKPCEMQWIWKP